MRLRGSDSWQISVDDGCPQALGIALFVRAAAGLAPRTEPSVPPLDEDVVVEVSPGHNLGAAAEQWSRWWDALVGGKQGLRDLDPPAFTGLSGSPQLRDLVAELFQPAVAWTGARRSMFMDELMRGGHPPVGIEGDVVRAAERESGRRARPFTLRITVLPVAGAWWGQRGADHLLISEQLRADAEAYRPVLRPLVDTLL